MQLTQTEMICNAEYEELMHYANNKNRKKYNFHKLSN